MFKNLDSLVTSTDEVETEIKSRIAADSIYYRALGNLLKKICVYT
jgi:hypothetical protein